MAENSCYIFKNRQNASLQTDQNLSLGGKKAAPGREKKAQLLTQPDGWQAFNRRGGFNPQ